MSRTLGGTVVVAAGAVLAAAAMPAYLAGRAAAGPGIWARAALLLAAALGAATLLRRARRRFAGPGSLAAGGALAALGLGALWWAYPETSPASFALLGAALAAAGLHIVCVTAVGARLVGLLGLRRCTRLSYGLLAFLVGWVGWGWAAFLLGLAGAFNLVALSALTLLAALAGRRELRHWLRGWWGSRRPLLGPGAPGTVTLAALLALVALAGALGPTRTVSPPVAFDELMYHLAAPRHYLDAGRVDFAPDIRGSYTPALSHMHYAPFVGLGLDLGAKLVNLAMSVALLLLAFEAGRAWGSRLAGAVAATLLALTPLTAWVAGTAYLGNALAALGLGTALFLLRGIQRHRRSWIAAAGVLAGGALFTKYQAIPMVTALALTALLTLAAARRRRRGAVAGALLVALGLAVLVPLPHWARNLWHAGNPVFPLLDGVFPTRAWFDAQDLEFFNRINFDNFGFGRGGLAVVLAPWRLVLYEGRFDAHGQQALGLIWLMLLPAAALGTVSRTPRLPLALAGLLIFGGWFATMQVTRYLLPALALATVLAGLGVAHLVRRPAAALATVGVLAAASALLQAPGALAAGGDLALVGEARERFLDARVPSHRVLRRELAATPEDSVVWAFMDQGAVYYYPRRVLGDWFGPYKYSRIAASVLPFAFRPGREVAAALDSWGVTHVLLNLPGTPGYRADEVDVEGLLAPRDPVLAAHLELLYGDRGVFLYAFDPAAAPARGASPGIGANRLLNPSFEIALGAAGGGWGVVGEPEVVVDPLGAPDGELVLRTDSDNYAYQYFPVRPGDRFLAGCRARADGGDAPLRLQVLWVDDAGEVVDSAIAVRSPPTGSYRRFSAAFTAPEGAARGIFHVLGHGAAPVRIDDVSLAEVGAPAAPVTRP